MVGPCGSGKTTSINLLAMKWSGFDLHHIAQEHSYVPDMWQRLVHPDILIFLEVGFEIATSQEEIKLE